MKNISKKIICKADEKKIIFSNFIISNLSERIDSNANLKIIAILEVNINYLDSNYSSILSTNYKVGFIILIDNYKNLLLKTKN